LADLDAGKISREELFARPQELLKQRMEALGPVKAAEHKPVLGHRDG
jgi:hypothetical protein